MQKHHHENVQAKGLESEKESQDKKKLGIIVNIIVIVKRGVQTN
jgi:hypothetical protein